MTEPQTLTKLIVLYMLDKFDFAITKAQIQDFILEKEYSNWFNLSSAVSELTEDGYIEASQTHSSTFVTLTDLGRESLAYFRNRISEGIRKEIDDYCEENRSQIANRMSTVTNYFRTSSGDYVAELSAREKSEDLINIRINVSTEEGARAICEHWSDRSGDIYSFIMENLL